MCHCITYVFYISIKRVYKQDIGDNRMKMLLLFKRYQNRANQPPERFVNRKCKVTHTFINVAT